MVRAWRYVVLAVLAAACGGGEGAETGDTGDGTLSTQGTTDEVGPDDSGDSGSAVIDSDTAAGGDSASAAPDSGEGETGSDTEGTGSDSSSPDTADTGGDSATAGDTGTDSQMDTTADSDSAEVDTWGGYVDPQYEPEAGIYVAPDGDDGNPGTFDAPLATFAAAVQKMQPGDTCIVRGGLYRQELVVPSSAGGTQNAPLTFRVARGEVAVVSALEPVSDWTAAGDGVVRAQYAFRVDPALQQLYYRHEWMTPARWPNDADGDRFTFDGQWVTDGSDRHMVIPGLPNADWTGAWVWYLGSHAGTTWLRPVTSSSGERIDFEAVDISKWPFSSHNPTKGNNSAPPYRGQAVLVHAAAALDAPGEWFYDEEAQDLYFIPPDGAVPDSGAVEVPEREHCVRVEGDWVVVRGLTCVGGNVELRGDHVTFADGVVLHGRERMDALTTTSAQVSDASVAVFGNNVTVANNRIRWNAVSGIYVFGWGNGGTYARIEGNEILYSDMVGIHASAVRATAPFATIVRNTVSVAGRDGLFVVGNNSEVAYNDVSFTQRINNDSGVFYTVGNENDRNIEIHHNWFHDAYTRDYADGRAAGIYLDNDSKGFLVHHNVVWNVQWSGVQMNWDAWNNKIFHNTLWNVGQAMGAWLNGRVLQNNQVVNTYSSAPDWLDDPGVSNDHCLIDAADPFVDAAGGVFVPRPDSPLVDAGVVIDALAVPYVGSAPDIGAYEAGGVQWTAGVDAVTAE